MNSPPKSTQEYHARRAHEIFLVQGAASGGLEQLLQAIPSGELQQLLGSQANFSGALGESPFGSRGFAGRQSSLGMGKLESLELPDAAAAVAMLHDMPPEVHISSPCFYILTALNGISGLWVC